MNRVKRAIEPRSKAPRSCCDDGHSKRQHVELQEDGSRVQVCDLCRRVVAVLSGRAA